MTNLPQCSFHNSTGLSIFFTHSFLNRKQAEYVIHCLQFDSGLHYTCYIRYFSGMTLQQLKIRDILTRCRLVSSETLKVSMVMHVYYHDYRMNLACCYFYTISTDCHFSANQEFTT